MPGAAPSLVRLSAHNPYAAHPRSESVRVVSVVFLFLSLALAGCASPPSTADPEPGVIIDTVSEAIYDVLPVEEVFVTASDGKRMHNAIFRPDTNESVPVFINFSPYWGNTAELGGDGFGLYLIEHLVPRGYAVVLSAIRGTGHSEGCFEVASDREVKDLYEVIDHFANVEWSSGAIATGGKSYDSTPQNGLIAKMPHPALKGAFHVSGITDMYRYNYVNGVPYFNGLTFTPRYAQTYGNDGSHPAGEPFGTIDAYGCTEMVEHAISGTGSAAHGMKDAYWQERDWTRFIGDSEWNGSIFFVHGFQDWNVKPDHILPWISNLPEQIRVKGWLHQDTFNSGHVYPMRADWNHTFIAWLETELKGKDLGFWDAPAWDVEGTDGLWREMDVWPPEDTERVAIDTYDIDCPTPAECYYFVTHTFDQDTRITGSPVVHVRAIAAPSDVLTAIFYLDGEWVGEAVLRAAYANGLDAPGVPTGYAEFALGAYPLDLFIPAGAELRIVFGEDARHSITAGQYRSMLYYPALAAELEFSLAPADAREDQPRATPCFAC